MLSNPMSNYSDVNWMDFQKRNHNVPTWSKKKKKILTCFGNEKEILS